MDFFTYRIVDERGSGGTDAAPQQQGGIDKNNPAVPKDSGGSISNAINISTLQQMGKGAINLFVGHVGQFTGSTALNNRLNAGAQLAGTAIQIASDPVTGLINLALKTANRALEIALSKKREDIELEEVRRRAGASYNQSRR